MSIHHVRFEAGVMFLDRSPFDGLLLNIHLVRFETNAMSLYFHAFDPLLLTIYVISLKADTKFLYCLSFDRVTLLIIRSIGLKTKQLFDDGNWGLELTSRRLGNIATKMASAKELNARIAKIFQKSRRFQK
ncbi:hypothetical protein H1R20_g9254, partial [Candolleomyces eurysporus]